MCQKEHNHARVGFIYLNDTAPARSRLHCIQGDSVGVLAATGEDDTAPPAAGRSRRYALRCSVAVQPVSISITLRHVDKKQCSISNTERGETNQLVKSDQNEVGLVCALMPFKRLVLSFLKHQPCSSSPAAPPHWRKNKQSSLVKSEQIATVTEQKAALTSGYESELSSTFHPRSTKRLPVEIKASYAGTVSTWTDAGLVRSPDARNKS